MACICQWQGGGHGTDLRPISIPRAANSATRQSLERVLAIWKERQAFPLEFMEFLHKAVGHGEGVSVPHFAPPTLSTGVDISTISDMPVRCQMDGNMVALAYFFFSG